MSAIREQVPLSFAAVPVRVMFGKLPLGVLRGEGDAAHFEVIDWLRDDLVALSAQVDDLLSPLRWHIMSIARGASRIWDVPVKQVLSKMRIQRACDARYASICAAREHLPSVCDEHLAEVFGRCRSWVAHAAETARTQREVNVTFRECYDRLQVVCKEHFYPPKKQES